MKLFLDCEFTQLSAQAKLISLALVAENGREFYVELLDTWRPEDCSDFVIEIVLPQLWAGDYAMPILDARAALLQYLGSFHQTLEVVTDAPEYDWMLFCELAHSEGKWPHNVLNVPFMSPDMVHPGVLTNWLEDDKLWVPVTGSVSFKPLLLSVTGGYYINLLRVRQAGVLSRHRHTGGVHAIVLKGRWYYLEHDWVASEGSFAYEPPGETHTLFVPEDVEEMITWFHVQGGYWNS